MNTAMSVAVRSEGQNFTLRFIQAPKHLFDSIQHYLYEPGTIRQPSDRRCRHDAVTGNEDCFKAQGGVLHFSHLHGLIMVLSSRELPGVEAAAGGAHPLGFPTTVDSIWQCEVQRSEPLRAVLTPSQVNSGAEIPRGKYRFALFPATYPDAS